jgi:hypothetical protein
MRDALRQSSANPFAPSACAGQEGGPVQMAQLSGAEFGGTNAGAEPEGTRGRWSRPIVSADIDCTQFKPKTGNIKLE